MSHQFHSLGGAVDLTLGKQGRDCATDEATEASVNFVVTGVSGFRDWIGLRHGATTKRRLSVKGVPAIRRADALPDLTLGWMAA